jgi:hypothetical protein
MTTASMRLCCLLCSLALSVPCGPDRVDAVPDDTPHTSDSWVHLGVVSIHEVGAGPGVSSSSSLRDGILTLRFCHVSRAASLKPFFSPEGDLVELLEFGLLVGKRVCRSRATASLGVGLGWAVGNGKTRVMENQNVISCVGPSFPNDDFAVVSLPLEAQFFFTPVPRVGLGISLLSNINTHRSVWGFLVGMQFRG